VLNLELSKAQREIKYGVFLFLWFVFGYGRRVPSFVEMSAWRGNGNRGMSIGSGVRSGGCFGFLARGRRNVCAFVNLECGSENYCKL
jgi:hypothetical protein